MTAQQHHDCTISEVTGLATATGGGMLTDGQPDSALLQHDSH
jgi:hypothetical protein